MIKKYMKYMLSFLAAFFCLAGTGMADNIQINGIQYPQNVIYPQNLKEDPFMRAVVDRLTGRFVGTTNSWILHLSRDSEYHIRGCLEFDDPPLYYVNGMISSEELVGDPIGVKRNFSFLLREKDGDYQLVVRNSNGANEVISLMRKQPVPELEKLYLGLGESYQGKHGFHLTFTQKDSDKFTGGVKYNGSSMPFTGKLERGGLCGEMKFDTRKIPFLIVIGKESPVFMSDNLNTELTPTSEKELAPDPGEDFIISLSDKVDLDMVGIKPGTFTMGSPKDELGRWDDETQHQVTLTQAYWLGKYEVTQKQYQAIMGNNPSHFKGEELPVENVSWEDARVFCNKLTFQERKAGRLPKDYEYKLPTEAQWEYACRAGTTTALNNGKNLIGDAICTNLSQLGWYSGTKCIGTKVKGSWPHQVNTFVYEYDDTGGRSYDTTHPVGQKQPNDWGLYDMHGNVYEWCLDCCNQGNNYNVVTDTYYRDGFKDPLCKAGSYHVYRGGGWCSGAGGCRSACRSVGIRNRCNSIGFRIALVYSPSISIFSTTSSLWKEWKESKVWKGNRN